MKNEIVKVSRLPTFENTEIDVVPVVAELAPTCRIASCRKIGIEVMKRDLSIREICIPNP